MKTTGFALVVGCAAGFLFSGAAGGCGGVTAALPGDGGTDGSPSSGSSSGGTGSGSSSGVSSSSSSSGGGSNSGGSSSGSGGSSSSSGISSSSSSGGSGSSSGVSSSSGSGGSSGGGPDTGTLYFEQCSNSTLCSSPQFDFYASFGAASGGNQGCTVTTSGACSSYSCTGTQSNPPGDSAGTLTLSGGSLGTVTVTPDSSNNYTYQEDGAFFVAGQTLTVSASGATVPAFGPISVVAPALPVLTAPAAAGNAYTLSTKADLLVTWTGGEADGEVIFEAASGSSASYFTCVWPGSQGTATVPQAMLAPLAGQTGGYLVYGQYTATSFDAGAYSISTSALPYSGGSATFE